MSRPRVISAIDVELSRGYWCASVQLGPGGVDGAIAAYASGKFDAVGRLVEFLGRHRPELRLANRIEIVTAQRPETGDEVAPRRSWNRSR